MTAREVVQLIRDKIGIPWNEQSRRDTFKIGDPDTQVTGVATTFMCMFDVIKRAHEAGLNMIIPHEDTWWNDPDDTKDLQDNALYKLKTEYCKKNNIVVWRIHDHQHAKRPDQSIVASLRTVGIDAPDAFMGNNRVYTIPETTLGAFASQIKKRTGSKAFRVVGDPNMKVTRVLLGPGYAYPRLTAEADIVIGGEAQEADGGFDNTSYIRDAQALGIPKGQIILGHAVSEEPGMEEFANWLRGYLTAVPVKFVPAGEPYWT
jgi:putative NIF3 family GTP cyclohydrolase 1 type 2